MINAYWKIGKEPMRSMAIGGSARWPTSTIPTKAAIRTNGKTFALRVKMRSGTSRSLHDRYAENPPIR
jgi:hypothetical protein